MKFISIAAITFSLLLHSREIAARQSTAQLALNASKKMLDKLDKNCLSYLDDEKKFSAPEATSQCSPALAELSKGLAGQCKLVYRAFSDSLQQTEALVLEALLWMSEKGTVRKGDGEIMILFSLSSDPTYPFNRSNEIGNNSLRHSYFALSTGNSMIDATEKKPECKAKESRRALAALREKWDGRDAGSVGQSHNNLGMEISNYMLNSRRELEAGNYEEAIKALNKENAGVKIRKRH